MAEGRVRLDVWLWAARFYKTRSLAADAVRGGHVDVGGEQAKAARDVRVGDVIEITGGPAKRTVVVRALADRRGPAPEAQLLYEETPESVERRAHERELRRLAPPPGADLAGRPTKRDRRRFDAARGRDRAP